MPCIVPFINSNLDISFFAFKPIGNFADDLIEALKYFSYSSEDHGCTCSSIFRSIHGNMVIWYGSWMKRSNEKKELLSATLISALTSLSSMAILVEYGFYEAYGGESKDGNRAAKFCSGDIISIFSTYSRSDDDLSILCYAYLALLKSCFFKMEGVSAGVCFSCHDKPLVGCLHVWKSLFSYYSWLLTSNYRDIISPYVSHLSNEFKYDVFQVVYVSSDDNANLSFFLPPQMIRDQQGREENMSLATSECTQHRF